MLNKTLYESMPAIYIGSGVASLLLMDTALRYLPGVLLIAAGALVALWRYQARSTQPARRSLGGGAAGRTRPRPG
ncbi:MAG: hypothetical protein PHP86_08700 [Nevskiales bacterium]|nr:hypothetical protein [Nevskiales bacterium]